MAPGRSRIEITIRPGSRAFTAEERCSDSAATHPRRSSPKGEPAPMMCTRSGMRQLVHTQIEEMGGAGDARIVIADHHLAAPAQRSFSLPDAQGPKRRSQVFFHARLVLTRGRNDARASHDTGGVDIVTMPEKSARRLGAAIAGAGARCDADIRCRWLVVNLQQTYPLAYRNHDLERACHNAVIHVAAGGFDAKAVREVPHRRRKTIKIEVQTPEWTDEVGLAVVQTMQRRGMRFLMLDKPRLESIRGDIQPAIGDHPALVHRILLRMAQ